MGTLFWTQRHHTGPSPRRYPAMAFDPTRKRTVLLGGEGAQGPDVAADAMADTWEWDGSYWTQTSDIGPPAAGRYEMAWDPSIERALLFGGAALRVDTDLVRSDTWAWDGQAWTQLLDQGPRFRTGFAMTADTRRGRIVLFGGATRDEAGQMLALADTWEWSGGEWTQQEDLGPSPRSGHAMSFDAVRNVCVLNGGTLITGEPQRDTWEWDGTRWTRRSSEVGPGGRIGASLVFTGQHTLLFGGQDWTSNPRAVRGDTWSWDGRFWTQRQDIGPKRESHGMAYDAARERTVVFGGQSDAGVHGDTWELTDHAAR